MYVLLGALIVVPGMLVYAWNKRRRGEALFNRFEWFVVALVLIGAAFALAGLLNGTLVLD